MNVLTLKDVSAGYAKTNVVEQISLDIEQGQIFGLIGLNGVGKTTLIKTILGLRDVHSGDIQHLGKENIAFLPERFDPPWFLSGYKFLKFSQKIYNKNITLDEAKKLAADISLNPEMLTKDVKTYSKGMRQKLGLIATIISGCKLIILDEPMSGLDPKARQEVKRLILNAKEQGQSIFMSSHILSDISELCDKVAVLHNKEIIFSGSPSEMNKAGNDNNLEKAFLNIIKT